MCLIIGLLPDPGARRSVSTALSVEAASGAAHRILYAEDWQEAHRIARRNPSALLIFDPIQENGLVSEQLVRFQESYPSVALLPYGSFPSHNVRDILRLAEFGIRSVAVRGLDDTPVRLRALIHEALQGSVAQLVMEELGNLVPEQFRPMFQYVLCEAYGPIRAEDVARLYCRHGKTLREHLRAAGLPPTQKLITWVRLFHAGFLLQDHGRTVANVAATLGFASDSAFRHQICRYAAVPMSSLRDGDALEILLRRFRDCYEKGNWGLDPPPPEPSGLSAERAERVPSKEALVEDAWPVCQ